MSAGPTTDTYQDLIKEVLDELLLEGSGSKQTVKIGSEELGNEITSTISVLKRRETRLQTCLRGGR